MSMHSPSRYMKNYGTSYYYATLFFPRNIKKNVIQLYKFVRIPDLVVDNKQIIANNAKKALEDMRHERENAYNHGDMKATWGDAVSLFKGNHIPFVLSKAFWEAMLQDTEIFFYENYEQLQKYMYGSAMVIGEMMCYIFGVKDEKTLSYARKLGEAMQMTNFLRDIKEDRLDLGRIYMPLEDLQIFSLSHRHIKEFCHTGVINDNREKFMAYQIQRCDGLYQEALQGLSHLPKSCRKAVYLSAKLYQRILRKIEYNHYNIFAHSARTNKKEKLTTLLGHMWKQT